MSKQRRGYSAWLVRWEWVGDHARPPGDPIIAVLPPQTGAEDVRRFVERYYAASAYTPSEKLYYLRRPRENPYKAIFGTAAVTQEDGSRVRVPWQGLIHCGHN